MRYLASLDFIEQTSITTYKDHTKILVAIIIMPNAVPEERAVHFTGCVVPFLTCIHNGPGALGHSFTIVTF